MPRYRYTALDEAGREVTSELEAESRQAAVAQLQAAGFTTKEIDEITGGPSAEHQPEPRELSERDFAVVGEALTNLTTGDLPLESGLRALSEEVPSNRVRRALVALSDRLAAGEPLEAVLRSGAVSLPESLRQLFSAGAPAGEIGPLLEEYLSYSRRAGELRWKMFSSLFYVSLLLLGTVAIVLFFALWIVPQFIEIFRDFDIALPSLTIALFSLSQVANRFFGWLLAGAGVVFAVVWLLSRLSDPSTRRQWLCAIPAIGRSFRLSSLAIFCRLLALLVRKQIPLGRAMRIAGAGCRDAELDHVCRRIADDLEQGMPLQEAAMPFQQLPLYLLHVFRWADRREVFPDALQAAGEVYEGQARIQIGMLGMVVEPLAIIGAATLIGLMVTALFLPLIQLLNDLG